MKKISTPQVKYKFIILLFFTLLAMPLFSSGKVEKGEVVNTAVEKSNELESKIDSLIESFRDQTGSPGQSVLVVKQGTIIYQKSFGLADIENGIKVNNETRFPIGSLTKQFTAFAILQLIMEGKLSLNDKLEKFISDFPNGDKVTVRNLLNHTSGISNYMHDREFNEQVFGKQSSQQMMDWFKDKPYLFEPGTRWNYTNSGYYLLGVIIEKVSEVPYAEYLKEHIFVPFGMENTFVAGSPEIIPNRASGYSFSADGLINAQSYDASVPFSAGAIISTVVDLWKFINNVHRSDNVSSDLRKFLYQQEVLPNGEKTVYTLGGLFVSKLDGHVIFSHPGSIYGYTAHEAYYPDDDIYIVILTNGEAGPASLMQKISREVLGIQQPEYVAKEISDKEISRLSGNYYFTAQTFLDYEMTSVAFNNGMLMLSMGNSKEKMYPAPFTYVGNGLYTMIADDEFTLKVEKDTELPIIEMTYASVIFKLKKLSNKYYQQRLQRLNTKLV